MNKKIANMILALSIPLLAVAEPSGRGADFGEVSSLATDVNMLILGAICLVVCTIFYFFKDRHKALETIFYIFLIIGGISTFTGGWSLLAKFVIFPIMYVITYLIKVLIYLGVVLIPYAIIYTIAIKIPNVILRMIICVLLAAACIIGEYYCIVEFGAGDWFPDWNFTDAFYSILYPAEE